MTVLHLHTRVEPMGPAAALVLSDDEVAQLGGGKRAAVVVRIADRSARLRIAVMGGLNVIGLSKANRGLLGVDIGQAVDAEVTQDDGPRTVAVPEDLQAALEREPILKSRFDGLAFTHRREYVEWVEQAKRPETRQRRIAGTLDRLREQTKPS